MVPWKGRVNRFILIHEMFCPSYVFNVPCCRSTSAETIPQQEGVVNQILMTHDPIANDEEQVCLWPKIPLENRNHASLEIGIVSALNNTIWHFLFACIS